MTSGAVGKPRLHPASETPRRLALGFVVAFVSLFIITIPFPYHILPNIGEHLRPLTEPVARWVGDEVLHVTPPYTAAIVSDSTGMYIHVLVLAVLSSAIAVAWSLAWRRGAVSPVIGDLFHVAVSYYLALTLLEYGLDKVFKGQFYLPEPNTLYTPLGNLSRDILYWSTMGAARGYTLFAGLLEVLPALLLLFRRTRVLGGMIATVVMVHIVAINLGFDISVKLYSFFLLLLCLIVARPGWVRLARLFILHRPVDGATPASSIVAQRAIVLHAVAKATVIMVIVFESLYPHVEAGVLDDDSAVRPFLHGAYEVEHGGDSLGATFEATRGDGMIRRFFIHRRGYFITESAGGVMRDHRLEYDVASHRLILDAHGDAAVVLDYALTANDSVLTLRRGASGDSATIRAHRIDLASMPLLRPSFHWTIDGYR